MSNSEMSHCLMIFTEIGLYFVVAKKNSEMFSPSVHKCLLDGLYSKEEMEMRKTKTKQNVSDAEMSWKN